MLSKLNIVKNGVRTNGAAGFRRPHDSKVIQELVNLNRAVHVNAVAEAIGHYCRRAFSSPAGLIFAEKGGDLQMVSHWRTGQLPKKHLMEEMIRKGPVARTFRTGETVVWGGNRMPDSNVSRFLRRLLRRCHCQNVAFVPICEPEQQPVGVLAIVLSESGENTSPVQDDLARLGQIVSACFARARAYDEALAARVRAESAVQSKDDFLSVLPHELKNPMMPILAWAVALSTGTLPEDKQNLALEAIVRNVRALNCLIEDLFDAARISSGKLRLQLAHMRIQDVVREALTSIQPAVETKKLHLSTDMPETIPPFVADPRRLQQVLMNLLSNAVKFTPAGGSISLRIRRSGDRVEGIVSDTGKGIDRRFLPFVFDRFRQDDHSSKVQNSGLGLGLAIVREIVELHGGSIKASSEGTDKGSTFVFRLPLRRRHNRSTTPPGRHAA